MTAELKPVSEWPVEQVPFDARGGFKGRERWKSYIAMRRCPHGGIHMDDGLMTESDRNSWISYDTYCERQECNDAVAAHNRALRQKRKDEELARKVGREAAKVIADAKFELEAVGS